jgi:hypothetical protein
MRQDLNGLVAQDAVEGGAADAELAGGAQLVAPVQVQDILHVLLNDRIQIQAVSGALPGAARAGFQAGGQGQIFGPDDAVDGFEQRGFQHRGQLAHVSRPVVLQQPGQRAGPQHHGALLVARADAVQQRLGQHGNVFAALAQRGNGKADGGEPEGQIGQQQALRGHLAQRGLRGGQQDRSGPRTVLQRLEHAQQQTLARRRQQVHAIQIE